jgi:FPC/CPF motif-containing protein YcgG
MADDLREEFKQFVRLDEFPCVGAKSALALDHVLFIEAHDIESAADDLEIHAGLKAFGEQLDPASVVQSCVILFHGPRGLDEAAFEKALWNRLQSLHNLDVASGGAWPEDVDRDPNSAHFGMSIGGHAYFVVGLHSNASRPARRFAYPALVFNSHEQFERLKQDGRFYTMQNVVRERDAELAGDINPMLRDFGQESEARQYSGRAVDDGWECPFSVKESV